MMLGPVNYIDEIKDYSFEELIKEREELEGYLKELEEVAFDRDKKDPSWKICPQPDVQYQMNLEYLAELCQFIKEKYSKEFVWGEEDEEE